MFLWIASLASYSQSPTRPVDPRWSLTVNDSLVHGPYTDFRLMAANRIVSDQMRRQAVRVMYGWMSLADNNRAEADKWKKSYEAEHARGLSLGAKTIEQQEALIACNADKSKLKAWATIGRIGVISVGVGVGAVATVAIINATKQK